MFGLIKGEYLRSIITHNVILANQKTDLFAYCWLPAHATIDIEFLPRINILTEWIKWRLMVRQMRESMLQPWHLGVANDTQNIQSSNWPKWHCALWHSAISCFLLDKMSFQMVWQTACRYVCFRRFRGHFKCCVDTLICVIYVFQNLLIPRCGDPMQMCTSLQGKISWHGHQMGLDNDKLYVRVQMLWCYRLWL